MPFPVTFDREADGRWIAEIESIPGCLAYGETQREAARAVEALALRILADRVESGEDVPEVASAFLVPA